ncbi:hypothetical protein A0H76_874 [Hepatospora eriocheir]|uniref:Mechanosensitive ion channel MscS domain-containing protein n=1 Tax=Hepatospora eriocheir TaxID=1081669 RepID=A0A1X0QDM6_9MICR|nr:hypothetical protein HERIO_277 [Hepatospora eriocheir]ORE00645.1 hypothetical protein A0H76_874 [Hepatospora eriocheir]
MIEKLKLLTKFFIKEPSNDLQNKLHKSLFVMLTVPFIRGDSIKIDCFKGSVISMNLFYLKLKNKNNTIYIPTSFIYDKVIEVRQ